ncbi:MAG: DNA-binding response regulator [Spongiibacteraceae bacterium]|jgi:DNA-binding response OmpR family regulator|nr:DNA-binding response regulator [Spongiibacteraceae bacterium]
MKLLIVEDDARLAAMITRGLTQEGYSCSVARDVETGLAQATDIDLIILDRMLPGGDGLELCRQLRAKGDRVPILMLSALAEVDERVDGLRAGADDYLGKPFDFEELLARVEALVRRAAPQVESPTIQCGNLTINIEEHTAHFFGVDISLTALEFDLLKLLARHPDRFWSRERIMSRVWPSTAEPETNVVDVYISRLRRKFSNVSSSPIIETRRGVGYRLLGSTGK